MISILFFGDLVGRGARKALKQYIDEYYGKVPQGNSFIIANVENAAGGFGLTKKVYDEITGYGVNVLTGGNHIWDKPSVETQREYFKYLALPANLPKGLIPGVCPVIHTDFNGLKLSIINLTGSVFMREDTQSPFETFDRLYENECSGRFVIVDLHAEATSEKAAFARYVKSRANAVIGTHTHVQTADEQMVDGTFFITDAGACAAVNSVLGMSVDAAVARFTSTTHNKLKVELKKPMRVCGVKLMVDTGGEKPSIACYERINSIYE